MCLIREIDVRLSGETIWLTQQQMSGLFGITRQNIGQQLQSVYAEDELDQDATCKDFLQVRLERTREVKRSTPQYNLDMIISWLSGEIEDRNPVSPVGYRASQPVYPACSGW